MRWYPRPRGLAQRRHLTTLWLAVLALYVATAARDVLPADSGEFQLIAAGWGIAHPPGYPLYTIVSALWVRLLGELSPFYALNLLSAVLAATTLTLIARATEIWLRVYGAQRRAAALGGVTAALLLGAAATFWSQATQANIRMPTLLFTAWGCLGLAQFRAAASPAARDRSLRRLAVVVGLAVGHHPSLVFFLVGWLAYLIWLDARLVLHPRRWLPAAGLAALAWALPQLYLPVRDSMPAVPLGPGTLSTWEGFWNHVLARGFGGDMFAFAAPADLAQRLPLLPTLFGLQFGPLILVLMAPAWLALLKRDTALAATLGLSWIVQTFVTITYRAPQTVEYLMPAYVPMVLVVGLGVGCLTTRPAQRSWEGRVRRWASVSMLAIAVARIAVALPDFAQLSEDTSIREHTEPLLESAPSNAVILADWHWATPLWALAQVEGTRPDVDVHYVLPSSEMDYDAVWAGLADSYRDRPLLTTRATAWEDWTSVPVAGGYRLFPRPLHELPEGLRMQPLQAALGSVEVLAYRIDGTPQPGLSTEVVLAWRAKGPQEPAPSFTARLWAPDGTLLAQADQNLGTDAAQGEIRFAVLSLQLPIDRCTSELALSVGVYTVEEGAFVDHGTQDLPRLSAVCTYPRLPTSHPTLGLILPGGPVLRGVDISSTESSGELQQVVSAYLHWCGPGRELRIASEVGEVTLPAQRSSDCQTVHLPVLAGSRAKLSFFRADGTAVRLLSLPLPVASASATYVPFGSEMVLVGMRRTQRGGESVLDLRWRAARPLVDDYAVSVRLLGSEGQWLGMHDIQPALGALPTLKWVTRGSLVLDPHPFPESDSEARTVTIVVYERFRLTSLETHQGSSATLPYPQSSGIWD